MAARPQVKTQTLTRAQLLEIFGTHMRVKAFEDMMSDVSGVLPDAVVANADAIEHAQATADTALGVAGAAQSSANAAQATASAAQADANALKTPSYLVLGAAGILASERSFSPGIGLAANDGGAGGSYTVDTSEQRVVLTADVSNATTGFVDAAGLAVTMPAGTSWLIDALLLVQSAAATTGLALAFTVPVGASVNGAWSHNVTPTTLEGSYNLSSGTAQGNTSGVPAPAQNLPVTGRWFVVNGAAAGPAQLQIRSEVAGSAVTVVAGLSVLRATRIA